MLHVAEGRVVWGGSVTWGVCSDCVPSVTFLLADITTSSSADVTYITELISECGNNESRVVSSIVKVSK